MNIDKPNLNDTEQCLLDVCTEFQFSSNEKFSLILDYVKVISTEALDYLIERIEVIEILRKQKVN